MEKSVKFGIKGLGGFIIGLAANVNVQTFSTNFSPDLYVTGRIPEVTPGPVLKLPEQHTITLGLCVRIC